MDCQFIHGLLSHASGYEFNNGPFEGLALVIAARNNKLEILKLLLGYGLRPTYTIDPGVSDYDFQSCSSLAEWTHGYSLWYSQLQRTEILTTVVNACIISSGVDILHQHGYATDQNACP